METAILWIGFIGAWLLFAGPIYQAALELQEQDIAFDRIKAVSEKIQKPPQVSQWWWLLPPIKIFLAQRRSSAYRKEYIKQLSIEDVESLISFMNKAQAWLFVAAGGFCIASKETYELAEHLEWGNLVLFLTIALMLLLSIFNLIMRMKRAQKVISSSRPVA